LPDGLGHVLLPEPKRSKIISAHAANTSNIMKTATVYNYSINQHELTSANITYRQGVEDDDAMGKEALLY
jgi:hypothetical protein